MKLKTKLALMSIAVSSLMCAVITLSAVKSLDSVTAAIAVSPAQGTSMIKELTPILTNESMVAATLTATAAYNTERIYMLIAIVGAGALLTWLLAGSMLKPLEKLTSEVKALSPDTLGTPVSVPQTRDEVGRLGEAFSEMTHQISEAYNMQKSFSASAAHELRTPLAVLSNEIDVFKLQAAHTQAEYAQLITAMHQSADRLTGIVEDLLTFTSQNAVDMSARVSLKPLIEEIVEDLHPISEQKNISINLTGTNAIINADDALMQRALYNLIENAVKYSDEGTTVEVNIMQNAVKVADNGCGIPNDEKQLIFEPFYRVDKSRSRSAGGSGLGLSIVKQICDKHGFEVIAQDNMPHGTAFIITFK